MAKDVSDVPRWTSSLEGPNMATDAFFSFYFIFYWGFAELSPSCFGGIHSRRTASNEGSAPSVRENCYRRAFHSGLPTAKTIMSVFPESCRAVLHGVTTISFGLGVSIL